MGAPHHSLSDVWSALCGCCPSSPHSQVADELPLDILCSLISWATERTICGTDLNRSLDQLNKSRVHGVVTFDSFWAMLRMDEKDPNVELLQCGVRTVCQEFQVFDGVLRPALLAKLLQRLGIAYDKEAMRYSSFERAIVV